MKFSLDLSVAVLLLVAGTSHGATTQQGHRQTEASDDKKSTVGLALNGGSNTAGNGCAGLMRGFQQQKVTINGEHRPAMEAFDLVSGLSGGNVPNMLYHYAPFVTSDEILDSAGINHPSMITMEDLEVIPAKSMFTQFVASPFSSILMIIAIVIATGASALYPIFTSYLFLQPFGIALNTKIDYAKIRHDVKSTPLFSISMVGPFDAYPNYIYFQMTRGFLTEFVENYKNRLEKHVTETGDFYYTTNNDYLMELAEKHDYQFPIPGFTTPQGLEIPFAKEASLLFDNIGNKTIDAVDFEPIDATFSELSSESDPFTIEETLGMATDISVLSTGIWDRLGVPSSMQDPMTINIPTSSGGKRKMVFTDGGYNDGCGVPPLVVKKSKNIISLWTPSPGEVGLYDGPEVANNIPARIAASCYSSYFGISRDIPPGAKEYFATPDPLNFSVAGGFFTHIFNLKGSNDENHIQTLIDNMTSLQAAGEPMITTLKNVEVVDNPFYGIKGGWTLDLTIVVNIGVPGKFAEQIPDGIATPPLGRDLIENGYFTNTTFASVPNVIANEDAPGVRLSLPAVPARMTQVMNSWIIDHAWEGPLIGADGKEKFGGFETLFQDDTSKTTKTPKAKKATKAPKRRRRRTI